MRIAPTRPERRLPALDGLRAVAVAMVMAYHGGVPGFRTAGFYGVDVFFVLSGYLITTLLLGEEQRSGTLRTGAFWGRRARRLLPGLLVMLAAVDLYVAQVAPAGRDPGFRGDALSVVAYISNWHFIAASSNYFQATGVPSLLTHTWSLAIEEQFYLVWPLVLLAVVRLARRLGGSPAVAVAALASAGALSSAAWMGALYREGAGLSRLYYGTDTHAQSILVGAALAGFLAVRPTALERIAGAPTAVAAAAGLVWAALDVGSADPFAYQGGFLFVSVVSATLIGVLLTRPEGPAARLLSVRPVVYVGRISYGMYLWYFPLFEVLDHARTGLGGIALFVVRCAVDLTLAAASFHLLEQPIRRWRPRRDRFVPRLAPLAMGAAAIGSVAGLVMADTPAAFSAGPLPLAAATSPDTPIGTPSTGPGGRPTTRILVVGDSTGAVLGVDLSLPAVEQEYGISVDDRALYGCGLVMSAQVGDHGVRAQPARPCRTSTPPSQQWPALLRAEVARTRPDLVLVAAGRWEVEERRATPSGPWEDITKPSDAADVRKQLELATSIAASGGARVGLATAPCFSSGEQPDGNPWPEDDPARLHIYNHLVRSVVAAHHGTVSLVDMDALVCPGGRYHQAVDGVTVRDPDGIHYPAFSIAAPRSPAPNTMAECRAFGLWVAPRILAAVALTG